MAQLLLDRGAWVDDEDQNRETALHRAVSLYDAAPMVRFLLDRGANLHAKNGLRTTPMYLATLKGQQGVVQRLLDHGAWVDEMNADGSTALHAAAKKLDETIVQLLLEWGASPCRTSKTGEVPLHYVAGSTHGTLSARLLLEHGAAVNARDSWGREPLYYAASRANIEILELLLRYGAQINMKHAGPTALHAAALVGDETMTRVLLDYGASINDGDNDGKTALSFASSEGHPRAVRLLLERGANVHARHRDGTTCLHLAARRGHESVIRALLEHRADADNRDQDGKTAVDFAKSGRHIGIVGLLRDGSTNTISADPWSPPISRKLVIVGDWECGKSCLLHVFSGGPFPEVHGGFPLSKQFEGCVVSDSREVRLQMQDTPGQDEYDRLRPLFYPDTHVVLICFEISSPDSLDNVLEKWAAEVLHFCMGIPIILLGCKNDLRYDEKTVEDLAKYSQTPVTLEQAEDVHNNIGADEYLECSAKMYEGVQEVFSEACRFALLTRTKKQKKGCWLM